MSVLRVNAITNFEGVGVVTFSKGLIVPSGKSIDGDINISGVVTATSFVGSGAGITVSGGVTNSAIFAITYIAGS